ncbi:family A G protein-coupled receptor-like protein [Conidiobolus coronatus NRRL 28638]|uniref:Family A G protein-coupled receptor-like protein n=1 Tax=Conidiobolus coronatus (strain ATCC 28846 / CBS 209.66 / NRRL 28638) TaxID=796925 RepID=A0A137NQV4_CONC2|nr:family A G protein-coupled receptor-like protein [Conidiobolus coronatus NRRL 28638]|eukprot:KXN65060.1 family A G protein-coupled receptor-like protein [Conidiobolus coronatus NRRL 28638]
MMITIEQNLSIYAHRPKYYIPLAVIFVIFGIIGISLTLILFISCYNIIKKFKKSNLKISLIILVSDLLTSVSFLILGLSALLNGRTLAESRAFCSVMDLFYIGSTYISIWLVALMSLERGLIIIHGITLPSSVWISLMAFEFLYYYVINLISIGFYEIGLANLAIYCMSTPVNLLGYLTICSYALLFIISFSLVIYSYIGIAIIQRKRAWNDIRELHIPKTIALDQSTRTMGKVILLLVLYLLANSLELFNTILEIYTHKTRSVLLDFISTCFMNFNPIINSLLLIQFQDQVKHALLEKFPFMAKVVGPIEKDRIRHSIHTNSM